VLDVDYRDTLRRLIEIDTSGPDARGCHRALTMLQEKFSAAGLATMLAEIPLLHADGMEGRVALLRRRPIREPAATHHIWSCRRRPGLCWDAFTFRSSSGYIYDRGVADMKRAIAALTGVLNAVSVRPLMYALSVVVTTGDETHQLVGQLKCLTKALRRDKPVLVLSLDAGFGYVSTTNLGVLHLDVRASGESVHSGLAHRGRNTVEGAARLIDILLNARSAIIARTSRMPAHPDTMLAFLEPLLNINHIGGGLSRNIVPDSCIFSIDQRLILEETSDTACDEILRTLQAVEGVQWSISHESSIPPIPHCNHSVVSDVAQIVREVVGTTGLCGEMMSDELPYAAIHWWNGIVFGAGLIRPECRVHGVDEHVNERDLDQLVKVLTSFLTNDREEAA